MNTQAASLLLAYAKAASIDLVQIEKQPLEDRFPRSLRRHPANADRSIVTSTTDLLCFHIGNALYTLHEFALGRDPDHVHARCALVADLAADPCKFTAYGDARTGFMLVTADVAEKLKRADAEEKARIEAEYEKRIGIRD